jgi:hypothetical protein
MAIKDSSDELFRVLFLMTNLEMMLTIEYRHANGQGAGAYDIEVCE